MKALSPILLILICSFASANVQGSEPPAFHPVTCDSFYPLHVQGVCTNDRDAIYWSWTDVLVKTDVDGHILKQVNVASHHGDLCFQDGRVYVAVNLGKFNEPEGRADSWVYVYDGETLAELARHPVPEAVHGAGGMAIHDGKFFVVGGLPPGVNENYLYEYDLDFKFQRRHVLASGYTKKGIQTVAFAGDSWWFGCYGQPKELLRADASLKFTGKWEFDGSYGIVPLSDGKFLVGQNTAVKGKGNQGQLVAAHVDATKGLVLDPPAANGK